jgi:hypothetical protein
LRDALLSFTRRVDAIGMPFSGEDKILPFERFRLEPGPPRFVQEREIIDDGQLSLDKV